MAQQDRCPKCGAVRSQGLCPRCLIELGSDGPLEHSRHYVPEETTDLTDEFKPGPRILDAIAATIGAVPRVLLRDTGPGEAPGPILRPERQAGEIVSIRYRIDGEIARGGMGAVLKGRDPDLDRDVALKVLLEDHRDNPEMICRFVEEAQIGGQLQHPGIVPIYELGTFADRRPFFSMKLVKGRHPAPQVLKPTMKGQAGPRSTVPALEYLPIFEAVCQTVAYAHARGVIHRDLKPSNVMVGSFGEVQVMDWGLAKVLPRGGSVDDAHAGKHRHQETVIATARSGRRSGSSRAGSVMGTPSYMAPEQARGEIDQIDERADVFALGSILCEILTGDPAFLGRSAGEILRKAALGETADALDRLGACGADSELVDLTRNCLAREPEDRPNDAAIVAERDHRIPGRRAGPPPRRRASLRRRDSSRRGGRPHGRRGRPASPRRTPRPAVPGGNGCVAPGIDHRGRADRHLPAPGATGPPCRAGPDSCRDDGASLKKRRAMPPTPFPGVMPWPALGRVEGLGNEPHIDNLRDEIQAGLEQAERTARLRRELVEIRANQGEEDAGPERTDLAYAAAFQAAGLDLDALEPAEFARRLSQQPEAVAIELAAFLDDWSAQRRDARRPLAAWRKPLEAARLADADPYRDRLRTILLAEDRQLEAEKLKALAAAPSRADCPPPPPSCWARPWCRSARQRQPWRCFALPPAGMRATSGSTTTWLPLCNRCAPPLVRRQCVSTRPRAPCVPRRPTSWGSCYGRWADGAEAEAIFRDLVDRRPDNATHLTGLGRYLKEVRQTGDVTTVLERAIAAAHEAVRRRPHDALAHFSLGTALSERRKFDAAIAEFRTAIGIQPDYVPAHCFLGNALYFQGKLDAAIAEYRETIRIQPDHAQAHTNLGTTLTRQGKLDAAIAEYREAIRIQPDDALAHSSLGTALYDQGNPDAAIAELRTAIRIQPDYAYAYERLGWVYWLQGKLAEAMTAVDEGLRFKPDDVELAILRSGAGREGPGPGTVAGGAPRRGSAQPSLGADPRSLGLYTGAPRPAAGGSAALPSGDPAGGRLAFHQRPNQPRRPARRAGAKHDDVPGCPRMDRDQARRPPARQTFDRLSSKLERLGEAFPADPFGH